MEENDAICVFKDQWHYLSNWSDPIVNAESYSKKGREVYSLALELYEFLKSKSPTILTAKSALDVAANMIEQNSKVN